MPQRVVFDSNVIISAIGWGGKPRQCLSLAQDGKMHGLTCSAILDEVHQKLIQKLRFSTDRAQRYIEALREFLEVISTTGEVKGVCKDPKDEAVLECAVLGKASYLVTGDRDHLLPIREFRGILIVSPAEFLRILEGDST
ncbi:putative toxin-antitoxin system toxin component, PIN family [Armatimonadetes bacterium GBS]|jgi:putative PIN family toxin of toxin-antitoxin system|nr:MAG: putative toxin-antitoxin system toxin component, PIN family [Fimbriimonadales bacterium]CUU00566.1 putative toxin-antitoxin system toxin component, PIN family [Armatimonadetes bacterium GBS]CUU34861.1 putative toxin-antitoxin system toxin component, PIN family [Armatimonadetes bacterium GXS]